MKKNLNLQNNPNILPIIILYLCIYYLSMAGSGYGFKKSLQLQSNKQSWDQKIQRDRKNPKPSLAYKYFNNINKNFAYIFP